jgi:hypothetical protein
LLEQRFAARKLARLSKRHDLASAFLRQGGEERIPPRQPAQFANVGHVVPPPEAAGRLAMPGCA